MRIWLACQDGHPRAVFSTAEGARDYVADHSVIGCWKIQYLVLDACMPSQRIFPVAGAARSGPGAGAAADHRMSNLAGGNRSVRRDSFSADAEPKPTSGLHAAITAALARWLVSPPHLVDGRSGQ